MKDSPCEVEQLAAWKQHMQIVASMLCTLTKNAGDETHCCVPQMAQLTLREEYVHADENYGDSDTEVEGQGVPKQGRGQHSRADGRQRAGVLLEYGIRILE